MSSKKPQDQSNEEWLADYDGRDYEERGVTLISRTFPVNQTSPIPNIDGFVGRYIDHRTIAVGRGCVALDFEDINTNIIATAFFNVALSSSHGNNYPRGKREQFIPPPRGKFRRFYIQTLGEEHECWSRVHKSLRNRFKDVLFTGEIAMHLDKTGNPYPKLRNVRAI